jgi:hypothetical protein
LPHSSQPTPQFAQRPFRLRNSKVESDTESANIVLQPTAENLRKLADHFQAQGQEQIARHYANRAMQMGLLSRHRQSNPLSRRGLPTKRQSGGTSPASRGSNITSNPRAQFWAQSGSPCDEDGHPALSSGTQPYSKFIPTLDVRGQAGYLIDKAHLGMESLSQQGRAESDGPIQRIRSQYAPSHLVHQDHLGRGAGECQQALIEQLERYWHTNPAVRDVRSAEGPFAALDLLEGVAGLAAIRQGLPCNILVVWFSAMRTALTTSHLEEPST